MTAPVVIEDYVDVLTDESRAGIYLLERGRLTRIAETSMKGVGLTLECLRDDGELDHDSCVGILDRESRRWLVNPYAHGRPGRVPVDSAPPSLPICFSDRKQPTGCEQSE